MGVTRWTELYITIGVMFAFRVLYLWGHVESAPLTPSRPSIVFLSAIGIGMLWPITVYQILTGETGLLGPK